MSIRSSEIDHPEFVRSLAETVVWCEAQADLALPATSLRSPVLSPYPTLDKRPFEYADDDLSKRPFETVSKVQRARRELLGSIAVQSEASSRGGRLLAYEPDWTLASGATEVNSEGFFNDVDTPPWDIWVAWIPEVWNHGDHHHLGYLVSWVPQMFFDIAAKGMWANDSESLWWLDESDLELARSLAQ